MRHANGRRPELPSSPWRAALSRPRCSAIFSICCIRPTITWSMRPAGRSATTGSTTGRARYLALHGRAAEIYDLARLPRLPADHRRLAARRLSLQLSAGDAAAERAVRAHPLCAGAVRLAVGELVRVLPRAQAGDAGARRAAARAGRARGADQRGRRAERLLDGGLARRRLEPARAAALSRRRPVRADDLQAASRVAAAGRAARRAAMARLRGGGVTAGVLLAELRSASAPMLWARLSAQSRRAAAVVLEDGTGVWHRYGLGVRRGAVGWARRSRPPM